MAGGSAAMAMACDMRFGALGKAVFNTMSVPVGAVPGGGASQYMPRLIGYSRAMELILGGLDLDAATAERVGLHQPGARAAAGRAVRERDRPAHRGVPSGRGASHEGSYGRCPHGPIEVGLREEAFRFRRLFASEESRAYVNAFLELGGETRDGEQRIEQLLGEVLERMQRQTATSEPDATR